MRISYERDLRAQFTFHVSHITFHASRFTHHVRFISMLLNKNHNEPKGIIFDGDVTLAYTMPLHWRAWQVIAARHRIDFPEARFYSLGGVPSRDILKVLSAEQGLGLDHLA